MFDVKGLKGELFSWLLRKHNVSVMYVTLVPWRRKQRRHVGDIGMQWRAQASGGAGAKWRYEGTIVDGGWGTGEGLFPLGWGYHDSRFYHDSLSCCFFYFASCFKIQTSCPSIMIICIQPQTWSTSGRGRYFVFTFFWATGMVPPRKLVP